LWYCKSPRAEGKVKFRRLFVKRPIDQETLDEFRYAELPDGRSYSVREMPDPQGELHDYRLAPTRLLRDYPDARLYRPNPLKSGGERRNQSLPYTFDGQTFMPGPGRCWKTTVRTEDGSLPGMDRLRI